MTFALDEAATICPVPLHKWTSVAAGYNITVAAGLQALSQLTARWGEHDGADDLHEHDREGDRRRVHPPRRTRSGCPRCAATWTRGMRSRPRTAGRRSSTARSGCTRRSGSASSPAGTSWSCTGQRRPVEAVITPVWDRKGYERADTGHRSVHPACRAALRSRPRAASPSPCRPGRSSPPAIVPTP